MINLELTDKEWYFLTNQMLNITENRYAQSILYKLKLNCPQLSLHTEVCQEYEMDFKEPHKVLINGVWYDILFEYMTYDKLCEITYLNSNNVYTATYSYAHNGESFVGIMHKDSKPVEIKNKMKFNICSTNNA